ncbi:hypothetical protein ON010_g17052 [Phytophthora cinnamomi]|nr:hypothetical protein ON010_g17052 [Phytophthora cinnamomi]
MTTVGVACITYDNTLIIGKPVKSMEVEVEESDGRFSVSDGSVSYVGSWLNPTRQNLLRSSHKALLSRSFTSHFSFQLSQLQITAVFMAATVCQICLDGIDDGKELVTNICGKSCSARVCTQCMGRHVEVTLQQFYPGVLPRRVVSPGVRGHAAMLPQDRLHAPPALQSGAQVGRRLHAAAVAACTVPEAVQAILSAQGGTAYTFELRFGYIRGGEDSGSCERADSAAYPGPRAASYATAVADVHASEHQDELLWRRLLLQLQTPRSSRNVRGGIQRG